MKKKLLIGITIIALCCLAYFGYVYIISMPAKPQKTDLYMTVQELKEKAYKIPTTRKDPHNDNDVEYYLDQNSKEFKNLFGKTITLTGQAAYVDGTYLSLTSNGKFEYEMYDGGIGNQPKFSYVDVVVANKHISKKYYGGKAREVSFYGLGKHWLYFGNKEEITVQGVLKYNSWRSDEESDVDSSGYNGYAGVYIQNAKVVKKSK